VRGELRVLSGVSNGDRTKSRLRDDSASLSNVSERLKLFSRLFNLFLDSQEDLLTEKPSRLVYGQERGILHELALKRPHLDLNRRRSVVEGAVKKRSLVFIEETKRVEWREVE